jgi:hypothetical protein
MSFARSVSSPQRQMRMLAFQKSGLGTPALAAEGMFDGTIADNGVGDYTITFETPFVRAPLCFAVSTTSAVVCRCVATVDDVQVLCFAQADGTTPAEGDFDIVCYGSDVADQL